MTSSKELRLCIQECELEHAAFRDLYVYLRRRIDDALGGFESRIECVVGPSRVGKTMLNRALRRAYPEEKVNGHRRVPVLHVVIPPNISARLLSVSVLSALGVPLPPRNLTSGVMDTRMHAQLKLAGTKTILFEEASHLVDVGSKVPPRAAADWLKALCEEHDITAVLSGVPRLERLFEGNEQLRLRASVRKEFRPYDSRSVEEQRAFASCVRTYTDLFERAGWPIKVPMNIMVPNCYLLTGGLIGVLSRFMQELAAQLAYEAPRAVTWDDCRLARTAVQSAGHPDFPAFNKPEVGAAEMAAAHAYVLETNDMSVRRLAASSGGQQ